MYPFSTWEDFQSNFMLQMSSLKVICAEEQRFFFTSLKTPTHFTELVLISHELGPKKEREL